MKPSEFLHRISGRPTPTRNDCGYEDRYEYEDTSRMFGWGPEEGEGICDYPTFCPWWQEGRCPFEEAPGA